MDSETIGGVIGIIIVVFFVAATIVLSNTIDRMNLDFKEFCILNDLAEYDSKTSDFKFFEGVNIGNWGHIQGEKE